MCVTAISPACFCAGGVRPFFWLPTGSAVVYRRARSLLGAINCMDAAEEDGKALPWAVDTSVAVFEPTCRLLRRCVAVDASDRPSAEELVLEIDALAAIHKSAVGSSVFGGPHQYL